MGKNLKNGVGLEKKLPRPNGTFEKKTLYGKFKANSISFHYLQKSLYLFLQDNGFICHQIQNFQKCYQFFDFKLHFGMKKVLLIGHLIIFC